jgi:hemolysin III
MDDLDHFAIYLFIAGTYTPFILNAISPPWNRALLYLVWSVAIGGIVYTHFRPKLPPWLRHRYVNTAIFVLMGWLLVVRLGEALSNISERQTAFLFAGAASYTLGAVIYALKRPNPYVGVFGYHEIWHVMVLLGFGFHYFMILDFYH